MSNNLSVELKPHLDGNGHTYYVGKLEFPGEIDCREGVSLLVFISEPGCEEIQIANLPKKNVDDKKEMKKAPSPPVVYKNHTNKNSDRF